MREVGVMWSALSVYLFIFYLSVPTQNRESQQVGDWKATVASIIEIHSCQGSRKQPEAADYPQKLVFLQGSKVIRVSGFATILYHGKGSPQSQTS